LRQKNKRGERRKGPIKEGRKREGRAKLYPRRRLALYFPLRSELGRKEQSREKKKKKKKKELRVSESLLTATPIPSSPYSALRREEMVAREERLEKKKKEKIRKARRKCNVVPTSIGQRSRITERGEEKGKKTLKEGRKGFALSLSHCFPP